jgi:competence protein ComEA
MPLRKLAECGDSLRVAFMWHSAELTEYRPATALRIAVHRRHAPRSAATCREICRAKSGITQMFARRLLTTAAVLAVFATPVFAQSPQPAKPAAPAAAATSPAKPAAMAKMVNLNTATAAELDALPQIGPVRAKAIVDARAKAKFKGWDDFVARKVVPSNAEAAIKTLVSF